ncbi:alkaline-phosphatase-like protein, partial [Pilobolus umbonatus]
SVTHVLPPYGGYDRYNSLHLGDDNFPVWLQQAGYYTNYIGKLMNGYTVNNYNNPAPKGFHHQDQLLDPFTYVYDTAVFSTNGEAPVYYPDAYQTDIIHAKTKAALKRIEQTEEPFFLWVAPMAPHGEFKLYDNGTMKTGPAVPAARHAHYFNNTKIPRTPHFNPSIQGKTASYWKRMDQLDDHLVEELDEAYRNRLRALQAVDDIVGTVFEELERQGKLENTYVVYSADNGYHIGQHRSYPGKCTNLEEDINVPLIVRGPGIPKKHISTVVSAHHDLGPTFLALAKGYNHVPNWVDGGVIPLTSDLANHPKPVSKESFAVEFWSDINLPEYYDNVPADGPNTYKTLRIISTEYNCKR